MPRAFGERPWRRIQAGGQLVYCAQEGPSRVTLVRAATNCLKGEKARDISGWRMGTGGERTQGTITLPRCSWEMGQAPSFPPATGPPHCPDAGTSSSRASVSAGGGQVTLPGAQRHREGGAEDERRGRGVRPGHSPAGEEVKQRVLLLLSARRHGRAGSAARRRRLPWARGRSTDTQGSRSTGPTALRQPPAPPPCVRARPDDRHRRPAPSTAWPQAPHRPLRREPGSKREPGARAPCAASRS